MPTEGSPSPTGTPSGTSPTPERSLDDIGIELVEVAGNFEAPILLTHAGDGSGVRYVMEQGGRVHTLDGDGTTGEAPFLDLTDRVRSGGEQGLLGLAFHPDYAENGRVFVNYTDHEGNTVISEVARGEPGAANPDTERVLLQIQQPFPNHNGGMVAFGPDGYLYIATGDGGSAGDPQNNGQRTDTLLGKLLRIDVDGGEPYAIPADTPFADGGDGLPEIWALGLRNPWRFSFDQDTGDLYVGDVGQGGLEEVDFAPAADPGGRNYGWRLMEGDACFEPRDCDPTGLVLPISTYPTRTGCAVTGGYVYRGATHPALNGVYLFADFCSGLVWALLAEDASADGGEAAVDFRQVLESGLSIASFGEDESGELYVVDRGGGSVYRVTASGG